MAFRRPSRRSVFLQILAVAVAMVMSVFVFVRSPGDSEALAAPPVAKPPVAPNSASPLAPAASGLVAADAGATPSPVKADADGGAAIDTPLDQAIAPDGGVPFHPVGTSYRSPFAKPNAGPPVRIRVGMLLNSIDDYEVKTGKFEADFFLSLTSDTAMPDVRLAYPNGKVEDKEVIADKPTFKLYRMRGSFKTSRSSSRTTSVASIRCASPSTRSERSSPEDFARSAGRSLT
jgi:hypothetical protein